MTATAAHRKLIADGWTRTGRFTYCRNRNEYARIERNVVTGKWRIIEAHI